MLEHISNSTRNCFFVFAPLSQIAEQNLINIHQEDVISGMSQHCIPRVLQHIFIKERIYAAFQSSRYQRKEAYHLLVDSNHHSLILLLNAHKRVAFDG